MTSVTVKNGKVVLSHPTKSPAELIAEHRELYREAPDFAGPLSGDLSTGDTVEIISNEAVIVDESAYLSEYQIWDLFTTSEAGFIFASSVPQIIFFRAKIAMLARNDKLAYLRHPEFILGVEAIADALALSDVRKTEILAGTPAS